MNLRYEFTFIFITFFLIRPSENSNDILEFPEGFLIGTATSAYQVEGGWNADGKGENVWDYSTHNYLDSTLDQSNGDISTDMYHKYKEDVKLLKMIGVNTFRFSISWGRILPTGYDDNINQAGIDHYHSLLNELEERGITPIVTIYHWDHPQIIEEDIGGWLSEKMAFVYASYARIVFREFGHRVKLFATVNEPYIMCWKMYTDRSVKLSYTHANTDTVGWGEYQCIHNVLKGHALAYRIYDKEFRDKQHGTVGIAIPCDFSWNKNENDTMSSEIAFEFMCGQSMHPIFSENGDYPKIVKERVGERSRLQGYNQSRLPTFTDEWIKLIKGSADFLGINHYSTSLVEPLSYSEILNWPDDTGLDYSSDPSWSSPGSDWLKSVPEGFGDMLRTVKRKYNNPLVYILENGPTDQGRLDDDERISYLYDYMKEMLIAIKRDGCNVQTYLVWSFLDSFEWIFGYTIKYGLVRVDFDDVNRTRTPKKSASWLKALVESRKLIPPDAMNYSQIQ